MFDREDIEIGTGTEKRIGTTEWFFHPVIGEFSVCVQTRYEKDEYELLIAVTDPDFDTSIIRCLTPDGATTQMPDLRKEKA